MLPALFTSASGLVYAGRRLQASAHNTANLNTARTAVVRVLGRQAPGGGVRAEVEARIERRPVPGSSLAAVAGSPAPAVDTAVEQIAALRHAGALRGVVRTSDDMLGALLDAVA